MNNGGAQRMSAPVAMDKMQQGANQYSNCAYKNEMKIRMWQHAHLQSGFICYTAVEHLFDEDAARVRVRTLTVA